ncbi:Gibberellin 2-beta-dioxygenase 1 [Hibiscus syriacus]|uniref:Gibberellin 2-beta-dioxygenase 1 n=1 Tax=Hibiscus syriacus TaxID=106335 RepID=A0A6A3CVQ8_HIBSY|nr:Gibberellin 2-beta-dioxygenase 1 [Hibiscus syriacus]
MVILSKPAIEQFSYIRNKQPAAASFPIVDLSKPDSKHQIIKACEEFGFFKVINLGVPMEFISRLEYEATKFFSLPLCEKEKTGQPKPYGYGNKMIGPNGDVGWVEYLLRMTNQDPNIATENPESLGTFFSYQRCVALNKYMAAVKKMACEILEVVAYGLQIQPRNVLSKLMMNEQSDSVFRLNHYPPCPDVLQSLNSNRRFLDSSPPDQHSFFINVGDSLQVMTNGRFKSVKHRVVANSVK